MSITPEQRSEAFSGSEHYAAGRMEHGYVTRAKLNRVQSEVVHDVIMAAFQAGYLAATEDTSIDELLSRKTMRYVVTKSIVEVIGHIWMPNAQAATTYELDSFAVENARDEHGRITRESVQNWLDTHAGDFQSIDDFSASIWDASADADVEIPWKDEESEFAYSTMMWGDED